MPLTQGSQRFRWQLLSVTIGTILVLAGTFAGPLLRMPYLHTLDLWLQDLLLTESTRTPLPENFLLVGLDDASLSLDTLEPEEVAGSKALQLMKEGFPWSREVYALAGQKILDAGARLVIFDLVFPGARAGDETLAEFFRKNPNRFVVAAAFDTPSNPNEGTTFRAPAGDLGPAAGDSMGYPNLADTGIIRRFLPHANESLMNGWMPLDGETTRSALATVAAHHLGQPLEGEIFQPRRFRYSLSGSMPSVSLYEIFVPGIWKTTLRNGEIFKNRVVLIGATGEGFKDLHETPLGRMSGPEIHLHFLAAILRGDWLASSGIRVTFAAILAAAAGILVLATVRRSPLVFLVGLAAGAAFWLGLCFGALVVFSYFLPVAPPLVTWLTCGFLVLACDAFLEGRERSRLRGTLERYVSRDIVKEIVDNPASYLQMLGGERKEIVTLFTDLKGFTAESETMDPSEMVALLNEYFGEMVEVIFRRQGTLDKFMGDALMATWGGLQSVSPADDAKQAVQAAFLMQQCLQEINARRKTGSGLPWATGTGITQGPVVFGNIGCNDRMELTAIGDAVNLASRIEGLTRIYGCPILVDGRVAENLRESTRLLLVDTVRVKGRQTPESLYFPYQNPDDEPWAQAFAHARASYVERQFATAATEFGALAQDGLLPELAALFQSRCTEFLARPPAPDWHGVWDYVEK